MIRVLFKDTFDSDYNFVMELDLVDTRGNVERVRDLTEPSIWQEEVDGDYSYGEWVCERLDEAGIKYTEPYIDMVVNW